MLKSVKFYRKVLKNGVTVILEKRDLPVVSFTFAVKSGGLFESAEEKGISHFIEHMMYKGTKKRTRMEIVSEIERNGGDLNGFTSENVTAFYCKIPSKHFDLALNILEEMIQNPLFDPEEIEKERKIIFEEMKMRKDTPRVYVLDKIHQFLYESPVGLNLIGTEKTMNSITRSQILSRFNDSYTSDNLIFLVVGNTSFDKVVRFAEKHFTKSKKKVKKIKIVEKNYSKIEYRKGIDQANLVLAYHVPLANSKLSYAAYLLNSLLCEGQSSRLFNEIREKRNLAYVVSGQANINLEFAYNMIYVGTTKENVSVVKSLILEEIKKVANTLSIEDLEHVKEQVIGTYQISMEDSQSQMTNLLTYELNGNAKDFYDFEKNIRAVKLNDIKKIASLALKKYSFLALVPK
ncbi:Insulinase (Peptidase family M16) [uncultured archaeon]|nr:Insulinase (Peptidase family M16) [uncultured archaeon]